MILIFAISSFHVQQIIFFMLKIFVVCRLRYNFTPYSEHSRLVEVVFSPLSSDRLCMDVRINNMNTTLVLQVNIIYETISLLKHQFYEHNLYFLLILM